jgi:adenosylmethionine-8-amino-7-oxononanoate aminotransferase
MPLSVTVSSDEIYESFNSSDPIKTFWHGHSYTGNPLGCAAGIASWKLLRENASVFKGMEAIHTKHLEKLADHPRLEKFRVKGTIAAMDIINEEEGGYLNSVASRIKKECVDHGLLLRPLGNVLYLMPPYCVTEDELDMIYGKIGELV